MDQPTGSKRGNTLLICQALYIGAQLGSLALARVVWAADMAHFLRLPLFLLGVCLAVAGLRSVTRLRLAAALATAACAVLPALSLPPKAAPLAKAHIVISVVSANVLGTNPDAARFFALPGIRGADILVLQEVPGSWRDALLAARDTWPWQSGRPEKSTNHLVILSRFPITDTQEIVPPTALDTNGRTALRARLQIGDRPLILYDVHAQTPRSPKMWHQRNAYLDHLAAVLATEAPEANVLLAGDWNTPLWSPFFTDFLARTGYRHTESRLIPTPTRFITGFEALPWLGTPIDRVILSPRLGLKGIAVAERWFG